MASPPVDWFKLAAERCESLPDCILIRQRLAQLEAALNTYGAGADNTAIPAMIAALFPPGVLLSGPGHSIPPPKTDIGQVAWPLPKPKIEVPSRLGRHAWRQALRIVRWLAPLLMVLLVAWDRPQPPPPPPSCVSCGPPPQRQGGHFEPQPPTKIVQPNPNFYRSVIACAVGGTMIWVTFAYLLLRMRRRLRSEANPDVDPVIALALRIGRANLFPGPRFDSVVKQLSLRQAIPSQRLDIRQSLRLTIARAGLPDLRFQTRRIKPEYLILSDREMPGDHLPEVGRALRDRLASAQLEVRHYEFSGAPWRLRLDHPLKAGGFEPVEAVMARHRGARVLISAESEDLDDSKKRAPGWLDSMQGDFGTILLNPREAEHWHTPESRLSEAGLVTVETAKIEPRAIARHYAEDGRRYRALRYESLDETDLPTFLTEDRDILLSDTAPDEDQLEAILANLTEHWLDPREMRWFRTLALFPLLHPSLTYFTAIAIFKADYLPVASYLKLVRLPWFRVGTMPDWLRRSLVAGMDIADFEQAKRIVQAFFTPGADRSTDADDILRICDEAGRTQNRRRFSQAMRRSDIPALKDGLLQSAFLTNDPSKVELLVKGPPARGLPKWLETAALLAIVLTSYMLIGESPTHMINVQQPPLWVADPPGQKQQPTPPPQDPGQGKRGGDRPLYVQIANPNDRAAASAALFQLEASAPFTVNGLTIAGIEYRPNSPASSQVRCFNAPDCKIASDVSKVLSGMSINARVNDFSLTKLAGGQQPLEIWFNHQDLKSFAISETQSMPVPQPNAPTPPTTRATPSIVVQEITGSRGCNKGPFYVFFDWDHSDITPEGSAVLDAVIDTYKSTCAGLPIKLDGYTDSSRSVKYSIELSFQETQSVSAYLVSHGLPVSLISSQSFGSTNPRIKTANGIREVQNRRVEITFGPASSN